MQLIKKINYPAYTLDDTNRIVLEDKDGNTLMLSHTFDQLELGSCVKKWCKDDIHFGNAPVHGMLPLRYLYYRTNKAKIPTMTRMGLE